MSRRGDGGGLALLMVLSVSASASAQSWEMSGVAGFTPAVELEQRAPELTDLSVRGGFTWAVQVARFMTARWGMEVAFTQRDSALEAGTPAGTADLYRIRLAQLQANVVYQFGADDARLRPFLFGGAGATFFAARDLESAAKPAFGFGGGLKYFLRPSIGVRGQIRYKATWLNDDPDDNFCDPFGFCEQWLQPLEVAAGVIIRF